MPTFKIKASELTDPSVNFVSMVKRGASRLPFKIQKEDKEMGIDLYALGRGGFAKSEEAPAKPEIIGAVLSKSADVNAFIAAAKSAGLEFDTKGFKKAEKDDLVTFTKADVEVSDGEALLLKVNKDVALVVKADAQFVKSMSSYDWESTSFSEVMNKGSFCPSVSMAQDMLSRTFWNIMEKADDKKELANLMKAATNEFQAFIAELAKGLPDSIFKAEKAIALAMVKADEKADDKDKKETRVGHDLNDKDELDTSGADKDKTDKSKTTEKDTKSTDDKDKKEVKKADDIKEGNMADMLSKAVAEGLKGVEGKIDTMQSNIDKRMSAADARLEKAEKALKGTVHGTDREDREIKKSEDEEDGEDWTKGAPPLLDTAFNRDSLSKH